jgi:hypothetical protein
MLVFATNRPIHCVCAALSIKLGIVSFEITDVHHQQLRHIFPLSHHAPPDVHEQARSPLRKADAVLLIHLDVLDIVTCDHMIVRWGSGRAEELLDAHSDDLEDGEPGEEDSRRRHGGWNCKMDETLETI